MLAWCWAALRSRWVQGVGVCVLVTLVVACAAFTPLYARALERSLVLARLGELDLLGQTVTVTSSTQAWDGPVTAHQLEAEIPPALAAVAGTQLVEHRVKAKVIGPQDVDVTLLGREGACAHLRFVQGRCYSARNQIVLSAPAATSLGVQPGDSLRVVQSTNLVAPELQPVKTLTVTGVFTQRQDDYWRGRDVEAAPSVQGTSQQTWFAGANSFTGPAPTQPPTRPEGDSPPGTGWVSPDVSVELQVSPELLTPQTLPSAVAALKRLRRATFGPHHGAQVTEQLTTVDERVAADRGQAGRIVPLLMVQLGLLLVMALWLALRSATQQRRPELALARVRGRGAAGARRLLLGELALPVTLGLPLGLATAWAVDSLVGHAWLPIGVGGGLSWWAVLAGCATLALVGAMAWWITRSTLAESVVSLLRGVPPRDSGARMGVVEAAVVVVAGFGVVALGSGALSGPLALVIPLLAAVAAGVLLGLLLLPLLSRISRRALARGRIGTVLVATGLARRPAVKPLLTAVVVSVALVVFGVNAFVLGQVNRQDRAEGDLGAPAVLLAATRFPGGPTTEDFLHVVDQADPTHRTFTPVVKVTSPSPEGPVTLAVRPTEVSRIMARAGLPPDAIDWAALQPQNPDGPRPAIVARWSKPADAERFSAPLLVELVGDYQQVGSVAFIPGAGPHTFLTDLADQLGHGDLRNDAEITNLVWSASADPHDLDRMERALHRAGFENVTRSTVPQRRASLDRSASAWGLQLGLVVGAAAIAVAVLVLVVSLLASWRLRAADLAALRRTGVPLRTLRSAAIGEQVVVTVVGVVVGAGVGVLGGRIAMGHVPFFADPPAYPLVHTGTVWPAVGWATLAALGALLATAVVGGLVVARRAVSGSQTRDSGWSS